MYQWWHNPAYIRTIDHAVGAAATAKTARAATATTTKRRFVAKETKSKVGNAFYCACKRTHLLKTGQHASDFVALPVPGGVVPFNVRAGNLNCSGSLCQLDFGIAQLSQNCSAATFAD